MKKLALIILIFAAVYSAQAQNRFELDVTTKLGYYIPANKTNFPEMFFPENAFSPGAGIAFGYTFFKNTGVFVGMEYSHLSPRMIDFTGNDIDVTWQSYNVPFNIQQGIGKNFFVMGGVTLIHQLKGYYEGASYFEKQKIPEYNWQLGVGYKLKDLRISMQYQRGFKEVHKYTATGESSWQGVTVMHQEVFLKLEYPLWKF